MNDWLALTNALNRAMLDHAPGWTDRNDTDPGITVLEILAYLAEGLRVHRGLVDDGSSAASRIVQAFEADDEPGPVAVRVDGERWQRVATIADAERDAGAFTYDRASGVIAFGDGRHGRVPERGSTIAARYRNGVGEEGDTSVTVRSSWPFPRRAYMIALHEEGTIRLETWPILHEHWSGTKRPRFFPGRLLTAEDLVEEQEYHLGKLRHHVRTLHGSGIVHGLEVETGTAPDTLTVAPGLAIDGQGREIHVTEELTLTVPADSLSPAWLVVEYVERPVDPVAVSSDGSTEPSRIEEGCRITIATSSCESSVAVARLVRQHDGWHVDPSFVPARPQ